MRCAIVIVLAGVLISAPAAADLITVTAEGDVTFVPPELEPAFALDDPGTAVFSFDSDAADFLPADPNFGGYFANGPFKFQVGGYMADATSGTINVQNDVPAIGDSWSAFTFADTGELSGEGVNGLALSDALVLLLDSTATMLSSDALPLTLDLADADKADFLLGFENSQFYVVVTLTSLTFVPEPSALASTGAALGTVGVLGRLRRRRRVARSPTPR